MNQATITRAEAKAYAFANPHLASSQLRERYQSLSAVESRRMMHRARTAAKKNGIEIKVDQSRNIDPLFQLAKAHAMENPTITSPELRALFPVSVNQSQHIVTAARKAAKDAKQAESEAKLQVRLSQRQVEHEATKAEQARRYVIDHPGESCEAIAKQFGVPATSLRRWRRMQSVVTAIQQPPPQLRPPRNKLFAIVDGVRVCPRQYRGSRDFDKCEGVKV